VKKDEALLALDPGFRKKQRNLGCALFEAEELSFADVVGEIHHVPWIGYAPQHLRSRSRAVIEMPRWYPREHEIDVNDLLDLACLVGRLQGRLEEKGVDVELVYPRTWKGTVPKDIHNKRVLAALSKEELALLPKRPRAKDFDHNLLDAVGIGLWKLGRIK
jgi:hypothetical protein